MYVFPFSATAVCNLATESAAAWLTASRTAGNEESSGSCFKPREWLVRGRSCGGGAMLFWCQPPLFHHKTQLQGQTIVPSLEESVGHQGLQSTLRLFLGTLYQKTTQSHGVASETKHFFPVEGSGCSHAILNVCNLTNSWFGGHPLNGSRQWPLLQWNRNNQVLLMYPWVVISFLSSIYSHSFFLLVFLEYFLFDIFVLLLKRTKMATYLFCTVFKLFLNKFASCIH